MTAPDSDRVSDVAPAAARQRGVLVMDDTASIRQLLGEALRRRGFAVWLAEDGAAAVEACRRHREHIDLILMDVRMPGLDGPQALAAIRLFCPRVPCCFMSGDFGEYGAAELLELGARAVFAKPFRLADTIRTVEGLTAEPVAPPVIEA